ncbi:hypothetical protein EYF80_038993 [Liparis tanakae]|uniref:Uncharacterized protein n=1 Tax=Liparis tanakae TaxID=230148 RepID=A0A4Z2GC17_9TELE|nr:hypothetical protein EYF80_038993 [Liparis tanakae]
MVFSSDFTCESETDSRVGLDYIAEQKKVSLASHRSPAATIGSPCSVAQWRFHTSQPVLLWTQSYATWGGGDSD